jgi:O-antigen/teichoic acid export membrane protein
MGLLRKTLTVWVMRIILTALIFLADLVISRYAGVALKGEYFFLTNNVLLIGVLLTCGLHMGNIYYFKHMPFPELAANSLLYLIFLGLILGLVYPLLSYLPVLSTSNFWLKAVFLACLFWEVASILFMNLFVATDMLTEYALVRILRRGSFLILLILAWVTWQASLDLIFTIFMLNFFILFIAFFFILGPRLPWRAGPFRGNLRSLGKCLGYGLKSQALVSVDMGNQRLTAVFLGFWSTPMQNGLYSVALNFGQALWVLFGVLAIVIQSGTSYSFEQQLAHLKKLSRHALPLMGLGAIAVAILGRPIIRLGYGVDFLGAVPQLYIILPGMTVYAIYSLLSSFMIVNGRAGTALLASLGGLLVNVLLSYLLIPQYGGIGAAQALCWGYLTSTLLLLTLVYVIFRVSLGSLLILKKDDISNILKQIKNINQLKIFRS